jgi:hypothetical protein
MKQWVFGVLALLLASGQSARAIENYREVTYDQLLTELNQKKSKIPGFRRTSAESEGLHAGIAYINSFANYHIRNDSIYRFQNGIAISAGIDLGSPQWYAETLFKNFGITSGGNDEISLREIDVGVGYKERIGSPWMFSLSAGLANRFLEYHDWGTGFSTGETTPSLYISSGLLAEINSVLSIGVEVSARSAFLTKSSDQKSFDVAFRLSSNL